MSRAEIHSSPDPRGLPFAIAIVLESGKSRGAGRVMEKAGNFLGGMLRQIKKPEAAVAWLSSVWPKIVGKTLAAHTRPIRCHAGCLEVAADTKAWRKQLEQMKPEFCAQVNKAWGSTLIREVKFAASKPGPQKLSRELDNEHIPFIRRRKS